MPVKRPMCLICLIFLMCIFAFTAGSGPSPGWDVDLADKKSVTVKGTVKERQEKNGSLQAFLSDVTFQWPSEPEDKAYFPKRAKGIMVKFDDANATPDNVRFGSVIEARGVFAPFDAPTCEGQFDARAYYMIRGYEGQIKRARLTGISENCNMISEGLRRIRDRAFDVLRSGMSEKDASVVAAMTLGDKTELDADIKELYQRAGISHILALSGV